jgi:hypothetical protein
MRALWHAQPYSEFQGKILGEQLGWPLVNKMLDMGPQHIRGADHSALSRERALALHLKTENAPILPNGQGTSDDGR